jgi:hypothetical protein
MNHSARRLNALAKGLEARRYLEIGVEAGETFGDVAIAERTGVDPHFTFDTGALADDHTRFVAATSDEFFDREPFLPPYDIVFIDGLHRFAQVVRDFSNTLLRTHARSVIVLDDTVPNDVYSSLPSQAEAIHWRAQAGSRDGAWHGDVFKVVFYLHDFWPGLNYRTIVGSGNPQTIVWRKSNGGNKKKLSFWKKDAGRTKPLFDDLEHISRLTYFDLQEHLDILQTVPEDEAIGLCLGELALP